MGVLVGDTGCLCVCRNQRMFSEPGVTGYVGGDDDSILRT